MLHTPADGSTDGGINGDARIGREIAGPADDCMSGVGRKNTARGRGIGGHAGDDAIGGHAGDDARDSRFSTERLSQQRLSMTAPSQLTRGAAQPLLSALSSHCAPDGASTRLSL